MVGFYGLFGWDLGKKVEAKQILFKKMVKASTNVILTSDSELENLENLVL